MGSKALVPLVAEVEVSKHHQRSRQALNGNSDVTPQCLTSSVRALSIGLTALQQCPCSNRIMNFPSCAPLHTHQAKLSTSNSLWHLLHSSCAITVTHSNWGTVMQIERDPQLNPAPTDIALKRASGSFYIFTKVC